MTRREYLLGYSGAAAIVLMLFFLVAEIAVLLAAAVRAERFQVRSSRFQASEPRRVFGAAAERNGEAHEALDEVNELRRSRGLPPFAYDERLTRGAKNVAKFRAARLIEGHTADDFRGLPRGAKADAAGCAAWHGDDWGSCCTFDRYRTAGAAWCRGRDGRRYMHLFVRR